MSHRSKIILGISFGHGDSSAALLADGKILAAAEEERFNRIKHYAGYPTEAVKFCLEEARLKPEQVQVVAIAKKPTNQFIKRAALIVSQPHRIWKSLGKNTGGTPSFKEWLAQVEISHARIHRTEHHLSHMLSTQFLTQNEDVAYLSFDGLGDFVSASIGKTERGRIQILNRVTFPHSLGFFYTGLTQYLGFPYFGDEFKVMGLSSYGQPSFISQMRNLIREAEPFGFRLNLEAFPVLKSPKIFTVKNQQPWVETLYNAPYLTAILGVPPRKPGEPLQDVHRDLAKSIQVRFEEIANHLLKSLESVSSSETLCLSGGCAHNSVWGGKIPQVSPPGPVS